MDFYCIVFGFGEGIFISDVINGCEIDEIIFVDLVGNVGIIFLVYRDG